ncbi:DUF6907 domain-containing protein [Streptomyces tendae]|uniref:DUF6907 domain-containing protein n=1 Tax=Streptomyces tendae TaxID=1932 RepID=UPI0036F8BC72
MSEHKTGAGSPAHRGGGPLPTFGPIETHGGVDELEPAVAVVRVAFALTRTQLTTALGISFAEIAADKPAEDLTDDEVRLEVEGQLAADALHELDMQIERDQARDWSTEQQRVMAILAAAVDRAYTRPQAPLVPPRRRQEPHYGAGTVTLQTLDSGEVTIREPAWCIGHDGEEILHLRDVSHEGPAVAAEFTTARGTEEILPAQLSWGPFGELQAEPQPVVSVAGMPSMGPAELRDLAAEVALHAGRLYSLANQLDRIRRGQS